MTIISGVVADASVVEELVWLHLRRFIEDASRNRGLTPSRGLQTYLDELDKLAAANRARRQAVEGAAVPAVKNDRSGKIEVVEIGVTPASKLLGIRRQSVQGLIDRGKLHPRRDRRGQWLLREDEVMEYRERRIEGGRVSLAG